MFTKNPKTMENLLQFLGDYSVNFIHWFLYLFFIFSLFVIFVEWTEIKNVIKKVFAFIFFSFVISFLSSWYWLNKRKDGTYLKKIIQKSRNYFSVNYDQLIVFIIIGMISAFIVFIIYKILFLIFFPIKKLYLYFFYQRHFLG